MQRESNVVALRDFRESDFETSDLLVFSHLRWSASFLRAQNFMSRFSRQRRVYFIEEPLLGGTNDFLLHLREVEGGVKLVIPHFPHEVSSGEKNQILKTLIGELIEEEALSRYTLWYYDPSAIVFTAHLNPVSVIYDCVEDFQGSPARACHEAELLGKADLVVTSGPSLFESKTVRKAEKHLLPNGIDLSRFMKARQNLPEPVDQRSIPHPRIGFHGNVDETLNWELIESAARLRPDWHFVLLGSPARARERLAELKNLHFLGAKPAEEIPSYLAGWDLAMLPLALKMTNGDEALTKGYECLAAGCPVIATAVADLAPLNSSQILASIVEGPEEFVEIASIALRDRSRVSMERIENFLEGLSWEEVWRRLASLETEVEAKRENFFFSVGDWGQIPVLDLV